jgi:cysteinyl-tRNA synthetase
MSDDLNIPAALAILHDKVREGNALIDKADSAAANQIRGQVLAMLSVLGLHPGQWAATEHRALDAALTLLMEERKLAREQKDFAKADLIRDQLKAAGIELSDNPSGTHWSID